MKTKLWLDLSRPIILSTKSTVQDSRNHPCKVAHCLHILFIQYLAPPSEITSTINNLTDSGNTVFDVYLVYLKDGLLLVGNFLIQCQKAVCLEYMEADV
jgi:hypothetical protein